MAPIPKRSTERAPAVDKLLKPAIVAVAAMMVYVIMQGLKAEIPRIDVQDELALREVFFGEGDGKSYAALCHTPGKEGEKELPVSSVFSDAANDGSVKAEFVLVDCKYELPSGKTVAQRFELDLTKRPTIFVSGKVGSPRQIPPKHLKTGNMLIKALKSQLEPRAAKIETTKQLKTDCLNKPHCLLFIKGGSPEKYVVNGWKEIMTEFDGKIQFASMDGNTLLLSNLESTNVPLEFNKGQHRMIYFRKVSGSMEAKNDTKTDRLISSALGYTGKSFHQPVLHGFVTDVLGNKYKPSKLAALPAVKTRTKKNEEAELQKRQRYLQQQERKRQQEAGEKPSSTINEEGAFTKEARKAQRDRMREDHQKNNPNYRELTPEEKLQKEQERRQRMEEEAAKWNIQSEEDYVPEGDPVTDEEPMDSWQEDDLDADEMDLDNDDDEAEGDDVMDLD